MTPIVIPHRNEMSNLTTQMAGFRIHTPPPLATQMTTIQTTANSSLSSLSNALTSSSFSQTDRSFSSIPPITPRIPNLERQIGSLFLHIPHVLEINKTTGYKCMTKGTDPNIFFFHVFPHIARITCFNVIQEVPLPSSGKYLLKAVAAKQALHVTFPNGMNQLFSRQLLPVDFKSAGGSSSCAQSSSSSGITRHMPKQWTPVTRVLNTSYPYKPLWIFVDEKGKIDIFRSTNNPHLFVTIESNKMTIDYFGKSFPIKAEKGSYKIIGNEDPCNPKIQVKKLSISSYTIRKK